MNITQRTMLVYVVTFAFLIILIVPASAQQANAFTPASGPPGTTVVVQCGTGNEQARLSPVPFSNAAELPRFNLDRSGRGSITIPDVLAGISGYNVFCIDTDSSDDVGPPAFGQFTVTACPAIPNPPNDLIQVPQPEIFAATQLRVNPAIAAAAIDQLAAPPATAAAIASPNIAGGFSRELDVTDGAGSTLRLVVSGNDPSLMLDYINTVRVDFTVSSVSPRNVAQCTQRGGIGFLRDRNPDRLGPGQGDINVELILLRSGIANSNGLFHVRYSIDPMIESDQIHTYHKRDVFSAESKLDNVSGAVQLTMWNPADYIDSLVYLRQPDFPALINSSSRGELDYFIALDGIDTSNEYTLTGSFTVEDECGTQCGDVSLPTLDLLDDGFGLTNGAPMNNGEFQVEGYCTHPTNPFQAGSSVKRTETDWYCGTDSNPEAQQLGNVDFNTICRLTYPQAEIAVAVNDNIRGIINDTIIAFSWRCYGR